MITFFSIPLFAIFLFLSSLHFYWGFGGRWGSGAVIPTKDDQQKAIMPGKAPTFAVAFGLLGFGLFVLIKTRIITFSLPLWLNQSGLWIIAVVFIVRAIGDFNYVGFFKRNRHTKFEQNDTRYYSPLCLLIGILALTLEAFEHLSV